MKTEKVVYFSDTDWDFVTLLASTGMGMMQAKMLVFLLRNGKGTSREIEHGTDLRQPEINIAGKKCLERGWIAITRKKRDGGAGRSLQVYQLRKSFRNIIADIEKETKEAIQKELALIGKIRRCL